MSKKTTTKRPTGKAAALAQRGHLNALPDGLDFRDRIYVPTLVEVPQSIPLEQYKTIKVPILDQREEGACTGFGLATIIHYLQIARTTLPDRVQVSPRMLYAMAKRYDEWPGENYDGSSARGAMKGWHKHGVCLEVEWPYRDTESSESRRLDHARARSAAARPLGAYFRVNHKDLVAMHSAIAEAHVLYATATVHKGWDEVGNNGQIPLQSKALGGHAFAIVAYDMRGFWIQNSWGKGWGRGGFAQISYDDWLRNGTDVWVARLGAPVTLATDGGQAASMASTLAGSASYAYCDIRPHIVSIGNQGQLRRDGMFGTDAEDVRAIFESDFPRITKGWKKPRILLYAHGGLTGEKSAIQRVADTRTPMLEAEVYPLAFIWKTDFWSTVTNVLQDSVRRRRPEGFLGEAKDFMLDRLDDGLEPVARHAGGKVLWEEMKENATAATTSRTGGARAVIGHLIALARQVKNLEIHVVGFSAGAIFLSRFVEALTGEAKLKATTCTLWAPAETVGNFKKFYLPAIASGQIERFALFALDDHTERDDHCADIYHKSLLYLVSHAFESTPRIPLLRPGEPIVGMHRWINEDRQLKALFNQPNAELVLSPNTEELGSKGAARSLRHGDFDDDEPTLRATLARVLNRDASAAQFSFPRSASSAQSLRTKLFRLPNPSQGNR